MNWPGYAECTNSGIEWLGEIPDSWRLERMRSIFTRLQRPFDADAETVTAFRDGTVTRRSNRRTDGFTEADKYIGYQGIEPGDLAIHAMDGFAGAIGVSDSKGKCSPVVTVCQARSSDEPEYFAHILRHVAASGYLTAIAKGIRERSTDFRWADARDLLVPSPPIETQRKIVSFLDRETAKIDALTNKQEQLIATLREDRAAEISDMAGLSGRKVPSLGLLLAGIKDGTHGSFARTDGLEGAPLLGARNIKNGRVAIDGAESFISETDHREITSNGFPRKNDILLVIVGATIGKAAIYDREAPLAFQRSVAFLRPTTKVNPKFLWYQIQSKRFQDELQLRTKTSAQPGIYLGDVATIPVYLPSLDKQAEIVEFLNHRIATTDALIDKSTEMIEMLREYRSALITNAVTGKIDVREAV